MRTKEIHWEYTPSYKNRKHLSLVEESRVIAVSDLGLERSLELIQRRYNAFESLVSTLQTVERMLLEPMGYGTSENGKVMLAEVQKVLESSDVEYGILD